MISAGYAYGMVPDWQSEALRKSGELVEIHEKANAEVKLYWHCWNLTSAPLQSFSKRLVKEAKQLLS
jgi:LysR family transcriptional regulator (chromosome initiation inhibitor)